MKIADDLFFDAMCRSNLAAFTEKSFSIVEPSTDFESNWHIACIAEHLMAVYDGEIERLIINMPPRSLKTHTTSVAFPAWCLGRNPTIQIMLTSFKAALAEKMTRKTRLIMQDKWYQHIFPDTKLSEDLNRQYYFETTKRGQYFSSSMSSVTGEGCSIQICDDPLAPDEALSDQVRESTIETIRGTLFSRFNDPRKPKFVLNMQRLHDGDPTGELLREDGWYHLKLPAEAKSRTYNYSIHDKSWELKQGEYLFPKRFTPEFLDQQRVLLGDYSYAGQYLQEPVPMGGGLINQKWLQYYAQGTLKVREMNICILVDPAGGDDKDKQRKNKRSDWTAMVVVGLAADQNYYLLDIIRDRLNPTERVDTLFMLVRKWAELSGKNPKVGYERYSMQSDLHYINKKMRDDSYNFPLIELGGIKSKTARISQLVPDMQNGRHYVPHSLLYVDVDGRKWDLVQELINSEIKTFPLSKHDDMLDAWARLYEPELGMVFPKNKVTMINRAISKMGDQNSSWMDF